MVIDNFNQEILESNQDMIDDFLGKEHWRMAPGNYWYSYHNDWNMLMSVVQKIEAKERTLINIYSDATKVWVDNENGEYLFTNTQHGNKDNKIGHVYRAVIEFVKWYNDSILIEREKE